ncbi:PIG-L family deacetylase [Sphingomonas sp. UV9]|uniref:PIG-L deacetylase family protein n=1 Tax=Sphingomonas sp. UV9 TaxID=1851410 RepID=UPI0013E8B17A|nr:PIG-L family deacetylase [Sphingomonas sp. UV9]
MVVAPSAVVAPGHRAWSTLFRRSRPMSSKAAAAGGPWLILAPHPDDETLGCGALIAAIVSNGGRAYTAFVTDGAGSHPDAPGWGRRRIAALRRTEAAAALRLLGGGAALHLDWPDATPPQPGDPVFERTADRVAAWCRARGIRRIAVTWDGEPHCDHEAAAALADAVAARIAVRVYQYLVWGWTVDDLARRVRGHRVVSIDTATGKPRQRRAMACHRSQRGGRIFGAAENFRLPDAMLRLLDRPTTLLLEISRAP